MPTRLASQPNLVSSRLSSSPPLLSSPGAALLLVVMGIALGGLWWLDRKGRRSGLPSVYAGMDAAPPTRAPAQHGSQREEPDEIDLLIDDILKGDKEGDGQSVVSAAPSGTN